MATIYDVARKAGVSTYTVSSVVNRSARVSAELTRRVLDAVRELNYTPNALARGLQTRSSKTVAMLIPDIGSPFYARVVRGVEDRLRTAGYSLLLGNTYNDAKEQARYLAVFRSQQADGFLVFVAADGEEQIGDLVSARKPVVLVGRAPRTIEADSVTADNVTGAHLMMEHLIASGHRKIAILTGHATLSTSADRVEGWRESLRKHKLTAPKEYVCEGDWTAESGYLQTLRLLDLPERPTAVFAANFLMMTGALRALKARGFKCPDDMQVVSSDDSDWLDAFDPPITTVVQPSYSMGEHAADLLLKRIRQPRRQVESVLLTPELNIRS